MSKTSENKEFYIQANVNITTTYSITAKDLNEAVEKSKSLKETDFVEILGDYIDGSFRITGAYEV